MIGGNAQEATVLVERKGSHVRRLVSRKEQVSRLEFKHGDGLLVSHVLGVRGAATGDAGRAKPTREFALKQQLLAACVLEHLQVVQVFWLFCCTSQAKHCAKKAVSKDKNYHSNL